MRAKQELTIGLARVAQRDAGAVAALGEGAVQRLAEACWRGQGALGDGEAAHQRVEALFIIAQARHGVLCKRAPRHLVGDEGVAVTVAADP